MNTKRRPIHDPFPPSTIEADFKTLTELVSNLLSDDRYLRLSFSGRKKFQSLVKKTLDEEKKLLELGKVRELLAILILCCAKCTQMYFEDPKSFNNNEISIIADVMTPILDLADELLSINGLVAPFSSLIDLEDKDFGDATKNEAAALVKDSALCTRKFINSVVEEKNVILTQTRYLLGSLKTVFHHLRTKNSVEFWSRMIIGAFFFVGFACFALKLSGLWDIDLKKCYFYTFGPSVICLQTPLFLFENFNFLSSKQRSNRNSDMTHFMNSWPAISNFSLSSGN